MSAMRKLKRRNRGSIVIEMSIIISVLLLVIYLYIMLLLSLIKQSNQIYRLVECMYETNITEKKEYEIKRMGELQSYSYETEDEIYPFVIRWSSFIEDSVDSIRRWQFATDIVS